MKNFKTFLSEAEGKGLTIFDIDETMFITKAKVKVVKNGKVIKKLDKYKGKLTPVEIETKNKEKQQYILEKIKGFQIAKQKAQQELITGLPHWENEYNIINSRPNI